MRFNHPLPLQHPETNHLIILHGGLFGIEKYDELIGHLSGFHCVVIDLLEVIGLNEDITFDELSAITQNQVAEVAKHPCFILGTGIGNRIAFDLGLKIPHLAKSIIFTGEVLRNPNKWMNYALKQIERTISESPEDIVASIFSDVLDATDLIKSECVASGDTAKAYINSLSISGGAYKESDIANLTVPNYQFYASGTNNGTLQLIEDFTNRVGANKGLFEFDDCSLEKELITNKKFLTNTEEILNKELDRSKQSSIFINRLREEFSSYPLQMVS